MLTQLLGIHLDLVEHVVEVVDQQSRLVVGAPFHSQRIVPVVRNPRGRRSELQDGRLDHMLELVGKLECEQESDQSGRGNDDELREQVPPQHTQVCRDPQAADALPIELDRPHDRQYVEAHHRCGGTVHLCFSARGALITREKAVAGRDYFGRDEIWICSQRSKRVRGRLGVVERDRSSNVQTGGRSGHLELRKPILASGKECVNRGCREHERKRRRAGRRQQDGKLATEREIPKRAHHPPPLGCSPMTRARRKSWELNFTPALVAALTFTSS